MINLSKEAHSVLDREVRDILSWLPCACQDMAAGGEGEADRLYEDYFTVSDLLGGKLYDASCSLANAISEDLDYRDILEVLCYKIRELTSHQVTLDVLANIVWQHLRKKFNPFKD